MSCVVCYMWIGVGMIIRYYVVDGTSNFLLMSVAVISMTVAVSLGFQVIILIVRSNST
jgi:hypothetical protein